jgi:3-hydroxyacyl-CoA dehydrogenase
VPDFVNTMVERKQLGNKTKGGFYKKEGKERFVLDWKTGDYKPLEKVSFPCVENAKGIEDVRKRVKSVLMESDDPGATFAWRGSVMTLIYSALLIPEIADSIVEIDRGMRWGYNWELGPFETWDAIGVRASVERMEKDGYNVPENVKKMLAAGNESFYKEEADGLYAINLVSGKYEKVEADPRDIRTEALRKAGKVIKQNAGATIFDMGDRVLLVEFHTKMNAVDHDIVSAMNDAVDIAEKDGWKGIVIGNHADAFSAGANLLLVFMQAQNGEFDKLGELVDGFQQANMRLRYSSVPVVAAVGGLALGGGCEIAMHANHVVLAGESYVGLVEVGVGLIPAGGGTKDFLVKMQEGNADGVPKMPLPSTQRAFETIAMAKVATSGKEAIDSGFFRPWEATVVLNRDHIIHAAKQQVIAMHTAGFKAPRPFKITLGGGGTYGALLVGADGLKKSGFASEYDIEIAKQLAKILTGGKIPEGTVVDENTVLGYEKDAFLTLLKNQKTLDRIQHMLMKNKPLRN